MKKLFVSVLAIAGLVACNNEETLFQQGPAAIEFEASHVEKATRVDPSITTETLAGFDVWAYMDSKEGKVLFGEDVTKTGGKWGYADTQYWMPGHHYSFTAIAPMNSENWGYAYEADTIAFTNVDGTEDLLLALAEADTDANNAVDYDYETVKLTFDHLLSKTKFTFKNGFTSKYVTVEVKDVKMTADAKAATYDVNARAWGKSAGEVTLAYGNVPVMAAGAKNEATDERLTIPAVEKEYTVEFDIYVYQGDNAGIEKHHKVSTIDNVVLEQGKAYNFVATISPETLGLDEIEFEVVEVNEWIYAGEDAGEIEEAELKAAMQLGGDVTLTKNYEITSPIYVNENVTLNLNGFAITNKVDNASTDVIVVAEGATLTINGEGTIEAVSGNDGYAIIADGAVVINGGTFKAGKDENGEANAVVYVRGEGKAFVNGGYFPNENASNYVLNKRDADKTTTVIEVRGGKFVGFDPANSPSEYPAESFLADGCVVVDKGDYYLVLVESVDVYNAEQLKAAFGTALEINLGADIDLSGAEWTPVGTNEDKFFGIIDGQNYTISGLTVTGDYAAFVAYADEDAVIKNVVFDNVNVDSSKYGAAVVCVAENNVTIENVTVSGAVSATSYAAGLVLMNNDDSDVVVIKNCENNATITSNRAGGIAAWVTGGSVIENVVNNGDVTGAISACGITNRIAGTIKNAVNNGNIEGNGTEASAGIAGTMTAASTFEYCYNYGNVKTTKDNANASAAGILGQAPGKAATFNYCANFGDITAEESYAAGIAYSLYGTVNASYCYNEGTIYGADAAGAIAPKAQYGANDKANYCLNAGAVSSKGKVYQASNKNTSCYYYGDGVLKNVADNAVVAEADALVVLNGGADADFFSTEAGKIVVK